LKEELLILEESFRFGKEEHLLFCSMGQGDRNYTSTRKNRWEKPIYLQV